jgi:hypothetical protein
MRVKKFCVFDNQQKIRYGKQNRQKAAQNYLARIQISAGEFVDDRGASVDIFGAQMSVSCQRLPVLVQREQLHLLDAVTRLE